MSGTPHPTIEGVTVAGPTFKRTWFRDGASWVSANPNIKPEHGPIRFEMVLGSLSPDGARTLGAMLIDAADWIESEEGETN